MNDKWFEFGIFAACNIFAGCISASCTTHVCFTWKLTNSNLTLVCTVNPLHHRVLVSDPHNNVQADCLPPVPNTRCDAYNANVSVYQNAVTNETTVIIKGHIDRQLNGIWTCRHGSRRGIAKVEVTVMSIKDTCTASPSVRTNTEILSSVSPSSQESAANNCIMKTVLWTMGGFLFAVISSLLAAEFVLKNTLTTHNTGRKNKAACGCIQLNSKRITGFRRFAFPLISLILLVSAFLVARFDKSKCAVQWIMLGLSTIVGILSTIMFRTKDMFTVESQPTDVDAMALADTQPMNAHVNDEPDV